MKLVRLGALVLVLAGAAAFVGVGLPEGAKGLAEQPRNGITVTGGGTVTTVPDEAGFWFGVEIRRKTAGAAVAAANERMRQVLAALEAAGIPDKDIQTAQVSVSPDYKESGDPDGYVASNSVSVTVGVDEAGKVVDAAVAAGADQVSGPNLVKSDTDALYRSALRAAVADARTRAEALASAAGVEVGGVIAIEEGSSDGPIVYDRATLAAEAPPIKAGTQEVEASVTVTFAIA
jgi:uncharacterized protein YggE